MTDDLASLRHHVAAPVSAEDRTTLVIYGKYANDTQMIEDVFAHDEATRIHSLHVNRLAMRWGGFLGLDPEQRDILARAALLHDIGKLAMPQDLLMRDGALNTEERLIIQTHVPEGVRLLEAAGVHLTVIEVVAQHHEHFDGNGYPEGRAGEGIDALARAVSVIDAFSAMTRNRPYHRAIAESDALLELERCAGTQFDPHYVTSFVAFMRKNNFNSSSREAERRGVS